MAKFNGKIGYVGMMEVKPGIWKETSVEYPYRGDFIKKSNRFKVSGDVNDNVDVSYVISIVADPYAKQNIHFIRYAVINGIKWEITDIDVIFPRLKLTIGGVYNGQ